MIYQASALDSQSFLSEETEVECYAAAASILRGDYGPGGCDDIMGESIFGGDMGHWWWWWCVSTWGFPSAWGRTRSQDKKKISEGIRGFNSESSAGLWTVSIICTNCYHTDPGLSGTTLSISSTAFISHSGATSGYTDSSEAINEKTISSNKVRRLFPKSSEKLDIKCNFVRRVGQESLVHGVKILNERVSMITVGHYRSNDKTQKWRSHSDAQTYWDVSVPSALCFILLKTNVFCLRSHQLKCLLKWRTVTCFLFVTLYINVLIISVGYT